MHSVWYGLGLAAAVAFILAGCASEPNKVVKHPEEYNVPPTEDPRYSQPPAFPKNVLNPERMPTTGDPASAKGKMGRPGGGGGPGSF